MTEAERKRKLKQISKLTAAELNGWLWAMKGPVKARNYFHGELAALLKRQKELGI